MFIFAISLTALLTAPSAASQDLSSQDLSSQHIPSVALEQSAETRNHTPEPCELGALTAAGYPSLHCFNLVPTPFAKGVSGQVSLLKAKSPFTVAVNADGMHRYRLKISLSGLPDPKEFGETYTTYMGWVTSPELRPVSTLGPLSNGSQLVGEVALNKYIILISAEESPDVEERSGRLVLRALSPSSRMEAHDLAILSPVAVIRNGTQMAGDGHDHMVKDGWKMPPPHPAIQMAPGMTSLEPSGAPFLPEGSLSGADLKDIPFAEAQEVVKLAEGDTLQLSTGLVRTQISGKDLIMYGFNGQYPGPLLHVRQESRITVEFTNGLEWPTAVHWHGLRLDNAFDGVPGVTQDPVQMDSSFTYQITFPDAGIYWYHPHHREDVQQDLGLYGNIVVDPQVDGYWNDVDRQEVLLLDDILLDDDGLVAYGSSEANYALMGRFGNTMLVNGHPGYELGLTQGESVRFLLTNTSNTRVFNVSIPGVALKIVASDVSKYEQEVWVESVVIAPAERYVLEAKFEAAGDHPIVNRVQGINHLSGVFFQESDTLGHVIVEPIAEPIVEDLEDDGAEALHSNMDVIADIDSYREYFDMDVTKNLLLTLQVKDLDPVVSQMMQLDPVFFNPVEWSGTMTMMNWQSSASKVRWILRDMESGAENMDIEWGFSTEDLVKVRITNDRDAFHAMQHPIHLHGQRFLILEQDGVRNQNLVWKDTILMPVGSTADILLDVSNPGDWMIHCHIAEHLETGMKMVFNVDGAIQINKIKVD